MQEQVENKEDEVTTAETGLDYVAEFEPTIEEAIMASGLHYSV